MILFIVCESTVNKSNDQVVNNYFIKSFINGKSKDYTELFTIGTLETYKEAEDLIVKYINRKIKRRDRRKRK